MGRLFLIFGALFGLSSSRGPAQSPPPEGRGPWKAADFGGVLSVGLEGHRSFEMGKQLFSHQCSRCHKLGDVGDGKARDLSKRALTYAPDELLAHILSVESHPRKSRGLLDGMSQSEVLDLLAFILSGADARSPFFFNP
jgi:mono/diheme cytochrome c family protein